LDNWRREDQENSSPVNTLQRFSMTYTNPASLLRTILQEYWPLIFCMDIGVLGLYCQNLGLMFSQYGSCAW